MGDSSLKSIVENTDVISTLPHTESSSPTIINKLKPQQTPCHQFRAPQTSVKRKKVSSSNVVNSTTFNNNKKCKAWNKRQYKNYKSYGSTPLHATSIIGSENIRHSTSLNDSENIQDNKRMMNNTSNIASSGRVNHDISKFDESHGGHIKSQQTHKKSMVHRGNHHHHHYHHHHHHHHVLGTGAIHNSSSGNLCSGGVSVNSNNNGINGLCCYGLKDCNGIGLKDNQILIVNNISTGGLNNCSNYSCTRSKFFLSEKRLRTGTFIPPTKFLLGGNISDPLNLNSLQNEQSADSVNNTPTTTPRQSPITTPPKVEVLIPPNIHDPLHLLDPVDSREYEKQLTSPMKGLIFKHIDSIKGIRRLGKPTKYRCRKNRKPKRRRHNSLKSSIDDNVVSDYIPAIKQDLTLIDSSKTDLKNQEEILHNDYSSLGKENSEQNITQTLTEEKSLINTIDCKQNCPDTAHTNEIVMTIPDSNIKIHKDKSSDLKLKLNLHCNSLNTAGNIRKRKVTENNSHKTKKYYRLDNKDRIVSPVIPQPGAWMRPKRSIKTLSRKSNQCILQHDSSLNLTSELKTTNNIRKRQRRTSTHNDCLEITKTQKKSNSLDDPLRLTDETTTIAIGTETKIEETKISDNDTPSRTISRSVGSSTAKKKLPKFHRNGHKYCYGNYNRFSGMRHINEFMDIRMEVFGRYPELFTNKDILDIGCNVGLMTIGIARKFAPKSILGIDIDQKLIEQARRLLAQCVRIPDTIQKTKQQSKVQQQNVTVKNREKSTRRGKRSGNKHQCNIYVNQYYNPHLAITFGGFTPYRQSYSNPESLKELQIDTTELFPISFPISLGTIKSPSFLSQNTDSDSTPKKTIALTSKSNSSTTTTNTTNTTATTTTTTTNATTAPTTVYTNTTNTISTNISNSNDNLKLKTNFPNNIAFRRSNYVLKDESNLIHDTPQYDLILCLSVTKWIHLNFGDSGLKLAFKRMFNQLRPGGKLILEAQNWTSYKKKKKLTEIIYNNYNNIEFYPRKFHEYLLSPEVGFSHSFTLGVPKHMSKGFCRPIQLYSKGDYTPNHVRWSDAYHPQTPTEVYRGIYATLPQRPGSRSSHRLLTAQSTRDTSQMGGNSGTYNNQQKGLHQSSTLQYYNPLETDSYLPSYDMEYLNHMYAFTSPLYHGVWSPPSVRNSSSHTPCLTNSIDSEIDADPNSVAGNNTGDDNVHQHVYPPNDDNSSPSVNTINAFNSIRDPDTDDSNQMDAPRFLHVYAPNSGGENSSSPCMPLNDTDTNGDANFLLDYPVSGVDQSEANECNSSNVS